MHWLFFVSVRLNKYLFKGCERPWQRGWFLFTVETKMKCPLTRRMRIRKTSVTEAQL